MDDETRHLILALRESPKVMFKPSGPNDVIQGDAASRTEIAQSLHDMRRQFCRRFARDAVIAVARQSWGVRQGYEILHVRGC